MVAAMMLAGAVLAVIGATAALSLLGDGVFVPGGKPLSQADVRRALAQPAATASPSQPGSAPATPHRHRRAVSGTFASSADNRGGGGGGGGGSGSGGSGGGGGSGG